MKFLKINRNEYGLYSGHERLGKGFIHESPDCKFYDRQRMNYFIEYDLEENGNEEHATVIVNNLVEIVKSKRNAYKEWEARVYHCCFAHDKNAIEFYQRIDGFMVDEGMHVLTLKIDTDFEAIKLDPQYAVEDNPLDTEEKIDELIRHHGESFKSGLYIPEDIEALKLKKGFKCISIRKEGGIVANLLLFIKADGVGFLEDMFVNQSERGNGLGKWIARIAMCWDKGVD